MIEFLQGLGLTGWPLLGLLVILGVVMSGAISVVTNGALQQRRNTTRI
jgi:hypothetical protein